MTNDDAVAASKLDAFQAELDDSLCTWPAEPTPHTRANAVDQWPKPITPLTQDLIMLPQERGLEAAFVDELGVAQPKGPWTWNGVFYGWVTYSVEASAELADSLPGWSRTGVYEDYFGVTADPQAEPPPKGKVNPLQLLAVLRNFLRAQRGYPRRSGKMRVEAEAQLRTDLARDWSAESSAALARRVVAHPDLHRAQKVPHVLASVISAAQLDQVVKSVRKLTEDNPAGLVTDAVSGLGGVHLAEASDAMREVAAGRMSREEFLGRYGYRGTNEYELAAKPWSEDPTTLERLIDAARNDRSERSGADRDAARARLAKLAGWKWPIVRWQLGQLQTHMRWRENGKIPSAMSAHSIRLVVREAARRLAASGRIDAPDDVYYLRADELVKELNGHALDGLRDAVNRRRETHKLAADFPLPEMIDAHPGRLTVITRERWRELGVLPPAELDTSTPLLSGVGGARGVATGRARIVADPNDVEIDEGDILVAAGTDSAWTPLFLQAAAVVVDVGGPMSHSAIAAREVGIPCVLNVKVGTTRIAEGQQITVDGTKGTVRLA